MIYVTGARFVRGLLLELDPKLSGGLLLELEPELSGFLLELELSFFLSNPLKNWWYVFYDLQLSFSSLSPHFDIWYHHFYLHSKAVGQLYKHLVFCVYSYASFTNAMNLMRTSFMDGPLAIFVIRKRVFKTSGRLLFSLLITNKYYTPKMFLLRIL